MRGEIMRLELLIEILQSKLKEFGDIEVLKTPLAPQIKRIKVRNNRFKPNDTYLLID